jgi:hypothetical protein
MLSVEHYPCSFAVKMELSDVLSDVVGSLSWVFAQVSEASIPPTASRRSSGVDLSCCTPRDAFLRMGTLMMEQNKRESKCYLGLSMVQRNSWLAYGAFDDQVNLLTSFRISPALRLPRNAPYEVRTGHVAAAQVRRQQPLAAGWASRQMPTAI